LKQTRYFKRPSESASAPTFKPDEKNINPGAFSLPESVFDEAVGLIKDLCMLRSLILDILEFDLPKRVLDLDENLLSAFSSDEWGIYK